MRPARTRNPCRWRLPIQVMVVVLAATMHQVKPANPPEVQRVTHFSIREVVAPAAITHREKAALRLQTVRVMPFLAMVVPVLVITMPPGIAVCRIS